MENNISEKVEWLIKENSAQLSQLDSLIKASEDYEKLLQEGWAVKRGFNIMTMQEIYTPLSNPTYTQTAHH